MEKYEIIKFIDNEFSLDVNVDYEKETVWLSQKQISDLFKRDISVISRHIKNIFEEDELNEKSNLQNLQIPNSDKPIIMYSLDVIISVGYRVKSSRGIEFRKWANKILKDYLIKGISINENRMLALNKTIEIQNKMLSNSLSIDEKQLSNVINEYTNALDLLDDYDHQRIILPNTHKESNTLNYKDARKIIDLMKFSNMSNIFGVEKEAGKLDGIIKAINQTAFGEDVYKTVEEKAANLLYFLVKDHPFVDGCKRIAATLFLEYLNRNNSLYKNNKLVLSNDALCAITILTAESNPNEKDIIINVIMRMIAK